MNNKTLYSIIAIVVILIVGAFVYMQSADETSEQANTDTTNSESMEASPESDSMTTDTPTTPGTNSEGTFSGETDVTNVDVAVHDISYDGSAYSPANITIKNGDIVRFKNNSSGEFWPASARHPDHLEYPEFDPKQGIAAGATWEFKFTKTGRWGFHDHLTPTAFGSVTVQ